MVPIVTPQEMGAIDAAAPEPVEVLIERAGAAVARAAVSMLGGTYGRRVVVIAGKGNNGNDGRSAARRLRRRGVAVVELDAADCPGVAPSLRPRDRRRLRHRLPGLVEGALGRRCAGARGRHPEWGGWAHRRRRRRRAARRAHGHVRRAQAGLAPGSGRVVRRSRERRRHRARRRRRARAHLVERGDVAAWLPARRRDAHKWKASVRIVAGSAGMLGAAHLASSAAQRAGAGMVRLSSPGVDHDPLHPDRGGRHVAPVERLGVARARRPRPFRRAGGRPRSRSRRRNGDGGARPRRPQRPTSRDRR